MSNNDYGRHESPRRWGRVIAQLLLVAMVGGSSVMCTAHFTIPETGLWGAVGPGRLTTDPGRPSPIEDLTSMENSSEYHRIMARCLETVDLSDLLHLL